MNISHIALAVLVVSIMVGAAILIHKRWLRLLLATALYVCTLFFASFGMGGLRVSIDQAHREGKSAEFVAGMASRNHELLTPRFLVLIFSTGLGVLAIAGWARSYRNNS